MLYKCGILVSALIIETGGCDCDVGSLRRAVQKVVSQINGVGIPIVKSIDRQNDLACLRVLKTPVNKIIIGISG